MHVLDSIGAERLAKAPLHLQLAALELAIEFMYRRITKSKLKTAEKYIRQRRNVARDENESSAFYALSDLSSYGGVSDTEYIAAQVRIAIPPLCDCARIVNNMSGY